MIWRWVLDIVLLLLGLWFGNLALAHWWAAGGPPNPNPEAHAFRGNIYGIVAVVCIVGFLVLLVTNIKRLKG